LQKNKEFAPIAQQQSHHYRVRNATWHKLSIIAKTVFGNKDVRQCTQRSALGIPEAAS